MLYEFLHTHSIPYERFDHPPLFTCEDAERLASHIPGLPSKNLFLRNKDASKHFLVMVSDTKRVNLGALSTLTGNGRYSFGSAEEMRRLLGVEPGSVTILGLLHDIAHELNVYIDREVWEAESIQCHPLINTSTLHLSQKALRDFIEKSGHRASVIEVPSMQVPA